MSKHFAHLHLHTEFSLLDGAIRINDLVRHAKEQQLKAVGITDHGNIFGAVKFFQRAKKEGIKPILGCEMYFTPDARVKDPKEKYYHLIAIVQNRIGYQNLRAVSESGNSSSAQSKNRAALQFGTLLALRGDGRAREWKQFQHHQSGGKGQRQESCGNLPSPIT